MKGNNMITKGMLTSNKDDWETPQDLFDKLNAFYGFTLDACASPENAKCKKYYTKEQNSLVQDWNNDTIWCNPPYGREIGKFVRKAYLCCSLLLCCCPLELIRNGFMITFTASKESSSLRAGLNSAIRKRQRLFQA